MSSREETNDDQLISTAVGQPDRTLSLKIISTGFLIALVGTWAIDLAWPVDLRGLAGAEKKRYKELRDHDSILDGSLANRTQSELRLKSRVRKFIAPSYSWFLLKQFSEAQGLYVGEEGFLFLKSRSEAPENPRPMIAKAVNQLVALERMLYGHGTHLVVVPIPRKAVVLGEWLPPKVQVMPQVEPMLLTGLRAYGISVVDLQAAYAESDPRNLFFRGDSHWTPLAEDLAAQEIARVSGILQPLAQRTSTLRPSGKFSRGWDLYGWMAVASLPVAVQAIYADQRELFDAFPSDGGRPIPRGNPEGDCQVLLAGTSFTAQRSMRMLLTHYSGMGVLNVGQKGVGAIQPLCSYLSKLESDEWPEVVVLEFPVSQIVPPMELSSIIQFGPNSSPSTGPSLVDPNRWTLQIEKTEDAERWTRVAYLPAGSLAHSGDGVLSLRLSGKVSVTRYAMQLVVDGFVMDFLWPKAKDQICLPLVSESASSGLVELYVRSFRTGALKLNSIDVVPSLDAQAVAVARAGIEPNRDEGPIHLNFPEGTSIPERSVLFISKHGGSLNGQVRLNITFESSQPGRQAYLFERLSEDAPIVVNLQGLAGIEIQQVSLQGEGLVARADSGLRAEILSPKAP